MAAFFDAAEAAMQAGRALTFATVDPVRGQVVGSTRFMRFHPSYRRVEIGYTFLAQSVQRSGVNVAAKFLMLQHAFEALGLNRVELITDVRNGRSRGAIEALGARQEGTLRSHMVMPDGRIRDSVLYAIIRDEWPDVRASAGAPRPAAKPPNGTHLVERVAVWRWRAAVTAAAGSPNSRHVAVLVVGCLRLRSCAGGRRSIEAVSEPAGDPSPLFFSHGLNHPRVWCVPRHNGC